MANLRGFFGNLMGGNSQDSNSGAPSPFFGAPTPGQLFSRWTGGNVQDQGLAQGFQDNYGDQNLQNRVDRNNSAIWGDPLMSGPSDPNDHPSQLRPSNHTVTAFGGGYAPQPTNQSASGAATSLGNLGMTAGHASRSQVEDMLSAGMGHSGPQQTQRREIGEERAAARAAGYSNLKEYRASNGEPIGPAIAVHANNPWHSSYR